MLMDVDSTGQQLCPVFNVYIPVFVIGGGGEGVGRGVERGWRMHTVQAVCPVFLTGKR